MVAEEPHCADCELYFSRVSLYNRHNHEKHAMEPEFYCDTCDKYFDDNPKLRRHKWQVGSLEGDTSGRWVAWREIQVAGG